MPQTIDGELCKQRDIIVDVVTQYRCAPTEVKPGADESKSQHAETPRQAPVLRHMEPQLQEQARETAGEPWHAIRLRLSLGVRFNRYPPQ